MAREDYYKLYQLSNILVSKYEFKQILIEEYKSFAKTEGWFINENDPNYNLIRVTFNTAGQTDDDLERIMKYIDFLSTSLKIDIRFLDIHISNEKYDRSLEQYDYLNIEEGYSDGTDVSKIYPEIYNVIHQVENQEKEIFNLAKQMQEAIQNRRKQFLKQHRPIATYITMAVCIAIYLISLIMSQKYSENTVYIFLGASYTTFTLGLKQYYRLITSGFVHGGFIHLLTNMYSLFFIGPFIERKYGVRRFFMILLSSIFVGTLCQVILSENTIILGISSGLYAFLTIFIISALSENRINFMQIMPLIIINLGINFISTTAWLAHVGGLICGYLYYLIYRDDKNQGYVFLLIVLIMGLYIRFMTIRTIEPFYLGTDNEILQIFNDLGMKKYAARLLERLVEVYTKYGG